MNYNNNGKYNNGNVVNIGNNSNKNGMYTYNSYKGDVLNSSNNDVVNEETRLYLLEKENKLNKRKKRKKVLFLITIILLVGCGCFYLYKNYFRPVKIDSRIDKNSIHYATDLYYSDGRFYEKYLDSREKELYLVLFKDLKELKTSTKIDCRNYGYDSVSSCSGSFNRIIDIILMEHPDLFWYRTSSYRYGKYWCRT